MRYMAITRLHTMLSDAGIPHDFLIDGDGWQIIYPPGSKKKSVCVARQHVFSIGSDKDLLEMRGLLTEDERMADTGTGAAVRGNLEAGEVFARIRNHYYNEVKRNG